MDKEYTTFEQIIMIIGIMTLNYLCNGNILNFFLP